MVGSSGYILDSGGWWLMVVDNGGLCWVVVNIFWLVVGGVRCWWVVMGSDGNILAGGGWWWTVVSRGGLW